MRYSCCRLLILMSAALQFPLGAVNADDDLVRIIALLGERESVIRSGRVTWDEVHTIQPGALVGFDGTSMPKSVVRSSEKGLEFEFDANRYIVRYYLQDFAETGKVNERSATSFDGAVSADYHPPLELEYGQGIVHKEALFTEFNNLHLWPFFYAFRPLSDEGAGLGRPNVQLSEREDDSRATVVLEATDDNSRRMFFLDSSSNYRLLELRYYLKRGAGDAADWQLSAAVTIDDYDSSSPLVDVPKAWNLKWFDGNGDLSSDSVCRLVDCEVNPQIPPAAFSLMPFPEGTLVTDERDGKPYWQRGDQLVPAKGPALIENQGGAPVRKWLLLANAVAFVAICWVWWAVRRRRANLERSGRG